MIAGFFIDVSAAVKLRHERGRQLNVDSLGGDPTADGDREFEEVSHFVPNTNVTCFEGKTPAMTNLLDRLRVSPLRDLYNETTLKGGSCIDTGYDLGPIDTCFGKTFMSGMDPDKQTQQEHGRV